MYQRIALVLLAIALCPLAAKAAPPPSDINAKLGLDKSTVIRLDVDHAPREARQVVVAVEDELLTLDLRRSTVRASGYRLYAVGADGVSCEMESAPERTYRGTVVGIPGSVVAASALEEGFFARIERPSGSTHWIEPLDRHFPERGDVAGLHAVYADADVLETSAVCAAVAKHGVGGKLVEPRTGAADSGDLFVAELACDADFDYFQDYGSAQAVEERINAIINQMNVQYERDVQITHTITAILVRTSAVYTTTDPSDLLTQFRSRWNSDHGDIERDVAHLFTGKNIDGGVIGIAFIGVICNTAVAYGLVQSDFSGNFACVTDVSAHELGHNWDAEHCTCPDHTMNPNITCTNQFSQASIDTILAHRDSRTCLEGEGSGGGPENDSCRNATAVGDGITPFDTTDATTDGPALPPECEEGFGLDFVSDIWYAYTAPCTGTATVSLCNSGYDTRLAVYEDGDCPGALVACNDDACGSGGLRSETSFAATSGAVYLVRIGGYSGTGTGLLEIECAHADDCPEDVDGDRDVGFGDVLRILANWGPCSGCPEDVDGNGHAGFSDILQVLAQWGPCSQVVRVVEAP